MQQLNYKAKGAGGDLVTVPSGSHLAVCIIIADLGLQPGSLAYPASKLQVYLRWEIPEERVKYDRDGHQVEGSATIGQTFTASMHEKSTLRQRLETWRGQRFNDREAEEFNIASILGKPCMLTVVENVKEGRIYSNVAGISKVPKGFIAPKIENKLLFYGPSDPSQFELLPEWLQKKIMSQIVVKPKEKTNPSAWDGAEITDDDIPF